MQSRTAHPVTRHFVHRINKRAEVLQKFGIAVRQSVGTEV
jgi:hypothetical protein